MPDAKGRFVGIRVPALPWIERDRLERRIELLRGTLEEIVVFHERDWFLTPEDPACQIALDALHKDEEIQRGEG